MQRVKALGLAVLVVGVLLLSVVGFGEYVPPAHKFPAGTTINYWCFPEGATYPQDLAALTQKFYELTGIKVNVTIVPWSTGNQKIIAAIAAGNEPDVMYTTRGRILPIIALGKNVIEPLDTYIEQSGIAKEILFPQALTEYKFYGKTWALGHIGNPHVWGINLDAFKKAGISQAYIDRMTDPNKIWTWIDFLYLARKLTMDTNGDGKVDQWGFVYPGGTTSASPFLAFYWNIGGHVVNPEGVVGIGDYTYTLPIMQLFELLKDQGSLVPSSGTLALEDAGALFLDGKAGFVWDLPVLGVIVRQKAGQKVPNVIPVYPPESPTGERGSFFAWDGVMMSRVSKHKEAAWEFIKYLVTSEDYKEMIMTEGTGITPITTTEDLGKFFAPLKASAFKVATECAKKGWYVRHEPANPASDAIRRAYNAAVQSVIIGKMTALQATDWLRNEALKAVKQSK